MTPPIGRHHGTLKPTVDIVIVDYNAGSQVRECLASIERCPPKPGRLSRVVVVDNASSVPTQECVRESALPLHFIRNEENCGFAAACNQGAIRSEADYLLFLNPDTILHEHSLSVPVAFLDADSGQRYAACGIQLVEDDGWIARSCARLPTPATMLTSILGLDRLLQRRFRGYRMREWPHDETCDVDHVIGAFYFIRRPVFESLGGFDERFFVYLEDLDLSLRIQKAGLRIRYLTSARAYHRGGGASERIKAFRLFLSLQSRLAYARKHFPASAVWLVTFTTLAPECVTRLGRAVAMIRPSVVGETLRAYYLLWRWLIRGARPGRP
ncbi:MAG: glycosyltransferase family 2 protein [Armatimonadetes bacterium]|nr:glycosyltransferase family 2 protein [Armatimonadota bacterium]